MVSKPKAIYRLSLGFSRVIGLTPHLHKLVFFSTPWHLVVLSGDEGVAMYEKNPKQQGGLFQPTTMLWDIGQNTSSILKNKNSPWHSGEESMIESRGISQKNNEEKRSSQRTTGQYQNRQLLLFTHHLPEAMLNWPRKRKAGTIE